MIGPPTISNSWTLACWAAKSATCCWQSLSARHPTLAPGHQLGIRTIDGQLLSRWQWPEPWPIANQMVPGCNKSLGLRTSQDCSCLTRLFYSIEPFWFGLTFHEWNALHLPRCLGETERLAPLKLQRLHKFQQTKMNWYVWFQAHYHAQFMGKALQGLPV